MLPSIRRGLPWSLALAAAMVLLSGAVAQAGLDFTGRWSSKYAAGATWTHTPVHLILTRGYSGHHSELLWYEAHPDETYGFLGGVWSWDSTGVDENWDCTAYPQAQFSNITTTGPTSNVFCSGHVGLSDGRVLISGGTDPPGETGTSNSVIFDPRDASWQDQGEMSQRRWYPTNTELPDGKVLVASGHQYVTMQLFGGRMSPNTGTLAPDSLQILASTPSLQWDPPARTVSGGWPANRDAHAAGWNATNSEWTIFGGRNQNGTLRDDVWFMYRNTDKDDREDYTAVQVAAGASPQPTARGFASVVAPGDMTSLIFGGQDNTGAKNDLWRLLRTDSCCTWYWDEPTTTGTPPAARQGHSALWDPVNRRMLVFGGADASGAVVDSTVYALSTQSGFSWSQPTVDADATYGKPSPRHGHGLVLDPLELKAHEFPPSSNYHRRLILFGGKTSSQFLNDLWVLWIPDSTSSAHYQWQRITPSGTKPSGRSHFASSIDNGNLTFTIVGGDSSGTASQQVWSIPLPGMAAPTAGSWSHVASIPQRALAGATMIPSQRVWARKQEIFNPASGTFSLLGTTKFQDYYPFHFVLPQTDSLRIFYAGATENSQFLNLSAATPFWRQALNPTNGFRGGSAVMYRPGEVMKCGSRDTGDPQGHVARGMTMRVNLSTQPFASSWTQVDTMVVGRVNHNLVVLPNGRVLCTGGTNVIANAANQSPVFTPQIWNPSNGYWTSMSDTTAMAPDSTIRGYHSNAILLPDGRVLTISGFSDEGPSTQAGLDSRRATIFCPPYLFNSNGTLRTRPKIDGAPDSVGYGETFPVCLRSATTIAKVALIKTPSSTHGFNQDQRYVPLTFQQSCDNLALTVTGPANARVAPPGDYMLFLVNNSDTPSIAAWVRVGVSDEFPPECPCEFGGFALIEGGGEEGSSADNALLGNENSESSPLRLKSEGVEDAQTKNVTLHQEAGGVTSIDQARLIAVDHPPGESVFATQNGFISAGIVPALSVASLVDDVTADAIRGEDGSISVEPGDTIRVELDLPKEGSAVAPLYLEARRTARDDLAGDTRLVIETSAGDGAWRTTADVPLRLGFADAISDSCGRFARFVATGRAQIRRVGHLAATSGTPVSAELSLEGAEHSRLGNLKSVIEAQDKSTTILEAGDALQLTFALPSVASGHARTLFFGATSSTHLVDSPAVQAQGSGGIVTAHRAEYFLSPPRPNPSPGRATIHYGMAEKGHVSIKIFDVAGRLVRTLLDGEAMPGSGEAVWNGRTDDGREVASGVYFYRMNAGNWSSRNRIILLSGR